MISGITYVSGFFDIERVTDAYLQNPENYYGWINQLFLYDIHLYFFTTEDIYKRLVFTPRPNLHFKILEHPPYYEKYEETKENWKKYQTGNPNKDTYQFGCLTNGKFLLLEEAIKLNPFNHTHYSWIDAGITKIVLQPELILDIKLPSKIKLLLLNYINPEEIKQKEFVLTCRYKIAGGFFIGPKDLMLSFSKWIQELIKDGIHGLEQEYMAIIYRIHNDVFDPYFGDFCDLIRNIETTTNMSWLIKRNLDQAFDNKDSSEVHRIISYLLKSPISLSDKIYVEEKYHLLQ